MWKKCKFIAYTAISPRRKRRCKNKEERVGQDFGRKNVNQNHVTDKRYSNTIRGLDRTWRIQEVEAPRFQGIRHMKVVRMSAQGTGRLTPQEIFLVLISLRGCVDPTAMVRPEGLCQWKIPTTPSGIAGEVLRYKVPAGDIIVRYSHSTNLKRYKHGKPYDVQSAGQ
jgi:hypothetical protein